MLVLADDVFLDPEPELCDTEESFIFDVRTLEQTVRTVERPDDVAVLLWSSPLKSEVKVLTSCVDRLAPDTDLTVFLPAFPSPVSVNCLLNLREIFSCRIMSTLKMSNETNGKKL